MLTARSVIVTVVVIVVLSVAGTVIQLMRAPDSGGVARDSYGTHGHGFRGLYEVLEELGVPVKRGLVPPEGLLQDDVCLVLWEPFRALVRQEPGYLRRVARWVNEGGVVVHSPADGIRYAFMTGAEPRGSAILPKTTVLKEIGLPDVHVVSADSIVGEEETEDRRKVSNTSLSRTDSDGRQTDFDWVFSGDMADRIHQAHSLQIETEGVFRESVPEVRSLVVPGGRALVIAPASKPLPVGRILYRMEDGTERCIVASYRIGRGTVLVVTEPLLFANALVAREDNAVLAAGLFFSGGRTVVFDEFYHGLSIRGNPIWILTQHPYGLLAALIVIAGVVWAWRGSISLGPRIDPPRASRRTVEEYVEAVSNLFCRGHCRKFVISELKLGVLWVLRKKLNMSPKQENVEDISRVLDARDKGESGFLRDASNRVESLVARNREPAERDVVETAREMMKCL